MSKHIEKLLRERLERKEIMSAEEADWYLSEMLDLSDECLCEASDNVKAEKVIAKFRAAYRSNKVGTFRQFMDVLLDVLK